MPRILGFIGCGKMAYALAQGIKKGYSQSAPFILCNDINKARVDLFIQEFGAEHLGTFELVEKSSVVFLAVKPQQIEPVLKETAQAWNENILLVSIAAGIKIADIEKYLPDGVPVVRVMPNTPCLVGSGVSAVSAGTSACADHLDQVTAILQNVGSVMAVEEKYMDAVTAVSGSGPAYAYLVLEAMMNAGVNIGLDAAMAKKMVLETFRGSIDLIEQSSDHPAVLREQVCSPAGTTIAGVRQLEANGIRKAFFDCVEAAYHRSIELGQLKK